MTTERNLLLGAELFGIYTIGYYAAKATQRVSCAMSDLIPDAIRLGTTIRGWECEIHGLVDLADVAIMPDGSAWHSAWGQCGADCRPVDLLVRDPRDWVQEGAAKMSMLANEVIRLRRALADIAERTGTVKEQSSMARQALFGQHGTISEGGKDND